MRMRAGEEDHRALLRNRRRSSAEFGPAHSPHAIARRRPRQILIANWHSRRQRIPCNLARSWANFLLFSRCCRVRGLLAVTRTNGRQRVSRGWCVLVQSRFI